MNIKFSFDETNVQVGFENQFVIKDMTEDTLVKILMLKGEKGDTVSGQWGTIIGNLADQTDLKNALDSKASASDLNTTNSNVATNTGNIATNTGNIATNTAAIEENAEDIADLQTQVGTNTGDIADLTTQVGTNTSNIATNTGNIATNTGNIATNTSNIGSLSNLKTADKTSLVGAVNELNDPTKWVSVGSTAPQNGERVWFAKGKNLFDLEHSYHGTINGSGTIGTNESFRTTQYIKTQPNTKYYFSTTQINGQTNKQIYIAFYDSNKTFISRTSYNVLESLFTTPSNCYYMRAGVGTAWQENIMLELGSIKTSYEPYMTPSINIDEEEIYRQNPVVLWENPDLTQDFASQYIGLNDTITKYAYYEVLYTNNTSQTTTVFSTGRIPINCITRLNPPSNTFGFRQLTPRTTQTQIAVGDFTRYSSYGVSTTTIVNSVAIPYKILGYK